jgi:RimJ/RimL family protein N-acetyltransferase
MHFDIQPRLENQKVIVHPLREEDFEELYAIASDPKVWEQHPNKERWQKEVFQNFFTGAMQSQGAFKIIDKSTGQIMGSSRYYDYQKQEDSILIGYTFYAAQYWGKGINHSVKTLMLDYIFQFVSKVYFHIGAGNVRSQMAITRLGATKIGEQSIAYYGEKPQLNFIYLVTKEQWFQPLKNGQFLGNP